MNYLIKFSQNNLDRLKNMWFSLNFTNMDFTSLISISNYIDVSSGSVILQALLGALLGLGVAAKIYWERIKQKLGSVFSKSNEWFYSKRT